MGEINLGQVEVTSVRLGGRLHCCLETWRARSGFSDYHKPAAIVFHALQKPHIHVQYLISRAPCPVPLISTEAAGAVGGQVDKFTLMVVRGRSVLTGRLQGTVPATERAAQRPPTIVI